MSDGIQQKAALNGTLAPTNPERYFKSIEGPFAETLDGLQRQERGLGVFIFVFVFSLIPVVPFVVSTVLWHLLPGRSVHFHVIHFSLSSFWFWWVVLFLSTLALLIIAGKIAHPSATEKKRWLSPAQMRFAYTYGGAQEIRMYLTNHRSSHLITAEEYVEKVGIALMRASTLDLVEGVYPYHYWQPERHVPHQGSESLRSMGLVVPRPKWYRLQPETESIVKAFRDFLGKLGPRLNDRKDLAAVESAMLELSRYLYTEIPELSESRSASEFEEAGTRALLGFAQQINDLPPYQSEPTSQTPKEKASQKLLSWARCLSWPFSQGGPLLSFFAWYVLSQALLGLGIYMALRFDEALRMDSTLVATLVGGPIATAVTAATLPRVTKPK